VTWSQGTLPLLRVFSRRAWGKVGVQMNGSWNLTSAVQPFGLRLKLDNWGHGDMVTTWLAVPVETRECLVICF
jgi:hypothetical protein